MITNTSASSARVTLTVFNGDGSIRDSRVHHSLLAPDEQWFMSIHEIVFDWLNWPSELTGSFEGYAIVYSDQSVDVDHEYTWDVDCEYMPGVMKQ